MEKFDTLLDAVDSIDLDTLLNDKVNNYLTTLENMKKGIKAKPKPIITDNVEIKDVFIPIQQEQKLNIIQVFKGGIGSGKTTGIIDSIIKRCITSEELARIGRLTKSMTDSAMRIVVKDSLEKYEQAKLITKMQYKLTNTGCQFWNGSKIDFVGFNEMTIEIFKSNPSSIVWCDEAARITKKTLETLINTIRRGEKPTAIFSYNPQFINDPILKYANERTDSYICTLNYNQNDYFKNNIALVNELEQDNIKLTNGIITQEQFDHKWLGKPMLESEDSFLITEYDLNNCENYNSNIYKTNTIKMGVDVARYGKDNSSIAIRQGNKLLYLKTYSNYDNFNLASEIIRLKALHKIDYIMIDADGIGSGVCDILKHHYKLPYFEIHNNSQASEPIRYANVKTEGYVKLANLIKNKFDFSILKNNEYLKNRLLQQLQYLPYKYTIQGKMQILPKDIIKDIIGYSPDEADSLMLTICNDTPELSYTANNNINNEPVLYKENYDWFNN